jgi:hypothetical protein
MTPAFLLKETIMACADGDHGSRTRTAPRNSLLCKLLTGWREIEIRRSVLAGAGLCCGLFAGMRIEKFVAGSLLGAWRCAAALAFSC